MGSKWTAQGLPYAVENKVPFILTLLWQSAVSPDFTMQLFGHNRHFIPLAVLEKNRASME
jgi:hypothetical protein